MPICLVASHRSPTRPPGHTLGALNIYSRTPAPFSAEDFSIAQLYASQAGVALANLETHEAAVELAAQLRRALDSRAVIEQAKGILTGIWQHRVRSGRDTGGRRVSGRCQMRRIGLLGGMSWESSVVYERIINETVRERLGGAALLETAGADAIVLCTNTMHTVADAIEAAISIPLLHIADVTADAGDGPRPDPVRPRPLGDEGVARRALPHPRSMLRG